MEDVRSEVRECWTIAEVPSGPLRVYLRAKNLGCRKYLGEQLKTSTLPTGRKARCQVNTPSRSPYEKSVSCFARPPNIVLRPGFSPAFALCDLLN